MRTIKFRAWHKAEKKMYVVDAMRFDYSGILTVDLLDIGDHYTRDSIERSEVEVMQYTGIDDRKGTQIYEGDIVRFKNGSKYEVGTVVFGNHNGAFCFSVLDGLRVPMFNFMSTLSLAATYDFEIIGNIYENSETEP